NKCFLPKWLHVRNTCVGTEVPVKSIVQLVLNSRRILSAIRYPVVVKHIIIVVSVIIIDAPPATKISSFFAEFTVVEYIGFKTQRTVVAAVGARPVCKQVLLRNGRQSLIKTAILIVGELRRNFQEIHAVRLIFYISSEAVTVTRIVVVVTRIFQPGEISIRI